MDGLHFTQKEMMAYAATIDRGSYKGDFLLYIDEDGNKEDVLCLITKYDIIEM